RPGSDRGSVQEEIGAVGQADDGAALVAQVLVDVPVQVRQDLVTDRLAGGDDVAAGTGEVDQLGRGAGGLPAHHTALEGREVAGEGGGEVIALVIAGVHDPRVAVHPGDLDVQGVPQQGQAPAGPQQPVSFGCGGLEVEPVPGLGGSDDVRRVRRQAGFLGRSAQGAHG